MLPLIGCVKFDAGVIRFQMTNKEIKGLQICKPLQAATQDEHTFYQWDLEQQIFALTNYNSCSIIVAIKGGGFMNDKALNIKIPSDLYNRLKEESAKKNISLASLVRIICSEYFERAEK